VTGWAWHQNLNPPKLDESYIKIGQACIRCGIDTIPIIGPDEDDDDEDNASKLIVV